jgi:hypothetical protein
LNRLGHMRGAYLFIFFEIGDGPCNFQYSRIGPGAHAQFVDSHFQKPLGILINDAMLLDLLVRHARIAERILGPEAIFLPAPGGIDPALDGSRRFAAVFSPEFPVSYGRHFNVNIDPVHQRTRNAGLILADLLGRAPACVAWVSVESTNAGIHGRYKHKPGRISRRHGRTCDRDPAVFQRLSECFEDVFSKLRQLVEKKHAVVRQTDLPGSRDMAAADQTGIGYGMVRRTKGPRGDKPAFFVQQAGDRKYLCCFDGFFKREIG